MAHPIKELAKLTTKSKQIDGVGFGGEVFDNLEVAGALGLPNPVTGNKLGRHPYYLARYVYCDDKQVRPLVRSALLGAIIHEDTGKIAEITLLKLINAALREFQHPKYSQATKKLEERTIQPYSKREISRLMNVNHKTLTEKHQQLYAKITETINVWASEAIYHLRCHLEDAA